MKEWIEKLKTSVVGTEPEKDILDLIAEIEQLDGELCAEHDARVFVQNNQKHLENIKEKVREIISADWDYSGSSMEQMVRELQQVIAGEKK